MKEKKENKKQEMHIPWAREKKERKHPGDECLLGLVLVSMVVVSSPLLVPWLCHPIIILLFPHHCHPCHLFLLSLSFYSPGSLLSTHNPPCEQVLTMVVVGAWGCSPPHFVPLLSLLSFPTVLTLVIIPFVGSSPPIVFFPLAILLCHCQ
jgi:hypothetical protein